MKLNEVAKKEINRMERVFANLQVKEPKKTGEFLDFALTYFNDGKYFYKKKKYLQAFEATIIAWGYVDVLLKLKWVSVPEDFRKNFTA